MATKTVVCPECGSAAAPGRYACAECGALLAAVAPAPRSRASATDEARASADDAGSDGAAITEAGEDAGWTTAGPSIDGAVSGSDLEEAVPLDVGEAVPLDLAEASPETPPAGAVPVASMARSLDAALAFDEDAPLGSEIAAHAAAEPDVLHDLAAEAEPDEEAAPAPAAPSWPPPGDRGPIPRPEPRTPAGAYLPPSAVLPPLDGPLPNNGSAAAAHSVATPAGAQSAPSAGESTEGTFVGRASAALTDAVESLQVTTDAARRAVAVGAGLAALGIVLPWINGLPGANPFAGYLDRWGLAGPGLWLVFLGLIALTAVAGSSGRTASWPVGLPAVGTATFVIGLLWPYLIGGFGRSIGIWVTLVGAIVLAVGGLLVLRRRHDDPEPSV